MGQEIAKESQIELYQNYVKIDTAELSNIPEVSCGEDQLRTTNFTPAQFLTITKMILIRRLVLQYQD